MSWFKVRNDSHIAKLYVSQDDDGLALSRIQVWKPEAEDKPSFLTDIDDLSNYGFDVPLLILDIEDFYENEREIQENLL